MKIRFVQTLAYFLFLVAFGIVVRQNIVLRRALASCVGSRPVLDSSGKPPAQGVSLLRPGDRFDAPLETDTGQRADLGALASAESRVIWLFDPACESCIREALDIRALMEQPGFARWRNFMAVSIGSRQGTSTFIRTNQMQVPVLYLPPEKVGRDPKYQKYLVVPQLMEAESSGRITRVFRSVDELATAFRGQ